MSIHQCPFFATQPCRATSSCHEPFHISRVCTGGFCSRGGCPQHLTVHFCHPPGFPSATYTRFKLQSVTHVALAQWFHSHWHLSCITPAGVSDLMGDCQLLICLYHTFRLLSDLVTKLQLTEFNPTLIPNHMSQGPKLLAEKSVF